MSVVEDVRQVIQDFLAPELRALTARIDALEVKMDSRFEALNARMSAIEERASLRHEVILAQMESVKGQLSLDYRLKKLEQSQEGSRA
jgi:hypothetical protein